MKQIIVNVSADGELKVEAAGFSGKSCERATAELIKALGVKTGEAKKPEYFTQTQQTQKAGHG